MLLAPCWKRSGPISDGFGRSSGRCSAFDLRSGIVNSRGRQSLEVESVPVRFGNGRLPPALADAEPASQPRRPCSVDLGAISPISKPIAERFVAGFEGPSTGWRLSLSFSWWISSPQSSFAFTFAVQECGSEHVFIVLSDCHTQAVRSFWLQNEAFATTFFVLDYVKYVGTHFDLLYWRRGYWEGLDEWLLPHELLGTRLHPWAGLVLAFSVTCSCRRWSIRYGATTTFTRKFFQGLLILPADCSSSSKCRKETSMIPAWQH